MQLIDMINFKHFVWKLWIGSVTEPNASINIKMTHLGREVQEVPERIVIAKINISMTITRKILIEPGSIADIEMKIDRETSPNPHAKITRATMLRR